MKKVLVTFMLALATAAAMAQGSSPAPAQNSQQNQQAAPSGQDSQAAGAPTGQKVIKDPAEYNAYIAALNTQDPAAKGAAMEAFLNQYPQSVVNKDALQEAMQAYQKAGNQPKVAEIANRILQVDPNNIQALAISTFIKSGKAQADPAAARADGEKGLQQLSNWTKPEGMSDKDFQDQRKSMTAIFSSACGFGALQVKDYAAARDCYLKSLEADPTNMGDTYRLGVANLEMNPVDIKGFWYIGKALTLAQAQNNKAAVQQITAFGKGRYKKYHGGDDGWDQLVAATGTQPAPPPDFTIKPAPTPAEMAVAVVQQNDPATLSFGDWEFVLGYKDASPANKDAADKVWAAIQDKEKQGTVELSLPGVKVVSATKDTIDAAMTEDNQKDNKADLHVTMEKPMLHPPAAGDTIDIIGVISDYTPSPFAFIMKNGKLPAPKVAPVHHPPVRKKPAQ